MCKLIEELMNDEKREIALRLLKLGKLSNEEIAESLNIDIEVVINIAEQERVLLN